MKPIVAVVIAAGVLVAGALSGVGRPDAAFGESAPHPRVNDIVTVTGLGTVETVPNEAQLTLGVRTDASSAGEAMERNAERMRRVILALREAGIPASEIQTQDISLMPRMKRNGVGVVGYTASSTVLAASGLQKVAEALDGAVEAGANQSYGFSLGRSDRDALYHEALRDAVKDARAKATTLAGAGNFTVGEVVRIEEGGSDMPVYETYAKAPAADSAMPIEPGTQELQARVVVTFAIR